MAVTKILPRSGGLQQAIDYVLNGDKTDDCILTAHFNCDPGREYRQMMQTKLETHRTDGRQCYHIIQSFRPGEITPELALEIAKAFAQEHLDGFEVVIGTHVDRHHIHSHIVFNSVNADTGEKYHSINAMDMEQGYGDGENPVVLKSEFLLSLCEQLIGAGKLSAKEKSIIDRCTAQVYRDYIRGGYQGQAPTLQDFHAELLRQPEKEAQDVALAIELFTDGSLNTFAKPTNVDTNARILCYDIRDLGKQLLPVGMLVVLDSIFNRIIRNRGLKRNTWIYIDEIYLLFQHEYSANFLFTLWKRMRKYQACGTGISQNIEDLLQSHTARTMLANSEFLIMLNQAATDREELAHLLNISDNQLSYITNVDSGRGLIKCGSAIVPFVDHFPKNKLYRLMTTKPSDLAA